ncbi:MAG: stage II sporulation protein M [Paenibacillaceae bacterium]
MNRFIRDNKTVWTELEWLLGQMNKKKSKLTAIQLDRFTELYKTVSAHLASMQTHDPANETTVMLNHLIARAHNMMYRESNKSSQQLRTFFLHYFPALIGARALFIIFALLLFGIGGLSGFLAVRADPLNLTLIVPANIAEGIDPTATELPREDIHSPIMSTTIMTNNIKVAVLAFISGITLGIGTVYLLIMNGLMTGALAAVFMQAGKSYVFWAYILPHGVIELSAIFIAGGAGLYMGYRIFVPGIYTRRHRLLETAKESAQLMLGTIPLFIIAGIIEGYITPSTLSLDLKYVVAAATLLLLMVYYVYGVYGLRRLKQ